MDYIRSKFSSKHAPTTSQTDPTVKNQQLFENSILIWLIDDAFRAERNENDFIERVKVLRETMNHVQIFAHKQECIDFIEHIKVSSVFLLLCDTELHGPQMHTLHDLSVMEGIYILSSEKDSTLRKSSFEKSKTKYPKLRDVYLSSDMEKIYNQLKKDVEQVEYNSIGMCVAGRSLDKREAAEFLYSQLVKEIFLAMKKQNTENENQQSFHEMIGFSREKYFDNPFQLNKIEQLAQDYHSHPAIYWYTQKGFLYKLLNHGLVAHHTESLYALRYFICQLHEELDQIRQKYLLEKKAEEAEQKYQADDDESCEEDEEDMDPSQRDRWDETTLFFAHGATNDYLSQMKANVNRLVSVSSFLSMTASKTTTMIFVKNQAIQKRVGFYVEVIYNPKKFVNIPYGLIYKKEEKNEDNTADDGDEQEPEYPGNEQWLFSMGSIFRLEMIRPLTDFICLALFRLVDDTDPELKQLTEHLRQEIFRENETPIDHLHRLVQELCVYDQSNQQFFQRLTASQTKN